MTEPRAETVFDIGVRTGTPNWRYSDSQWTVLNTSSDPVVTECRELIERWFAALCSSHRGEVLAGLRNPSKQHFNGAFWELYLHEAFLRLGFTVRCDPQVPDTHQRPDFLVSNGTGSYIVEATSAAQTNDERTADARRNRIYDAIDQLRSPDFFVGIHIVAAGTTDPALGNLRREVDQWVGALNADDAVRLFEMTGEPPEREWVIGDWVIKLIAFPKKVEARGEADERFLHMFMDETGGAKRDNRKLLNSLKLKATRYGDPGMPYVIAVTEDSFPMSDQSWHRTGALGGHEQVTVYPSGAYEGTRATDGFWRGPRGPQNTRVSAVILVDGLVPWSVGARTPEWWSNPYAARPVAPELIPGIFRQRRLAETCDRVESTIEPTITPASLFDLHAAD